MVVAEDNPYRDLRYSGDTLPPIKAFDTDGRVIYLRSFSKIFCPGLRLAFVVGHQEIVRRMVIARQFEDCCANTLGQYLLFEFCRQGLLDKQIEKNCAHYRKKRDALLAAMDEHFPGHLQWNRPDGGFFSFVHLPQGLDGEELLREAVECNVAFVAGAPFYVNGEGTNTLRLSFAQSDTRTMQEAIRVLGELLKKKL
jgi:2-aminoadipate transaminase